MAGAGLASIEDLLGRIDNLLRIVDEVPGGQLQLKGAETEIVEAAGRALKVEQERARFFGAEMFFNPGWAILLHLFVSSANGRPVDTGNLCLAAGVPDTVALRHLAVLVSANFVRRRPNPDHPGATCLTLTALGEKALCDYFSRAPRERDAAAA
jgi:hypothetical protein